MKSNYQKIEFSPGINIDKAVEKLAEFKKKGEMVYGNFNGHKLYSDIDDLDSAYKKITGKTKSEFYAEIEAENKLYEKQRKEHEESIPELTELWIEKGNLILDPKYKELWAKCVPVRLDDLYEGMELGATLEIVAELNAGCELSVAKEIILRQGHSGMSFSLVCSMVKSFCDRGEEFVRFVR